MINSASLFLEKALESLTGAQSEFTNGRHNNAANRCYYACFQAAIAALMRTGLTPRGTEWSHAYVPATFDGELINRRKLYASELRGVLARNQLLRIKADYQESTVSRTEASRAVSLTEAFVRAVQARGGGSR